MNEEYKILSHNIKHLLHTSGRKAKEVAENIEVTKGYFSLIQNNKASSISKEVINKIANYFEIDSLELTSNYISGNSLLEDSVKYNANIKDKEENYETILRLGKFIFFTFGNLNNFCNENNIDKDTLFYSLNNNVYNKDQMIKFYKAGININWLFRLSETNEMLSKSENGIRFENEIKTIKTVLKENKLTNLNFYKIIMGEL